MMISHETDKLNCSPLHLISGDILHVFIMVCSSVSHFIIFMSIMDCVMLSYSTGLILYIMSTHRITGCITVSHGYYLYDDLTQVYNL